MDLCLTDDQRMLQETTRRYLGDSCPLTTVRAWAGDEAGGFPREWWRQGAALGWTSLLVPGDLGGGSVSANGLADAVLVAEEMGRAVAPGPMIPTNVVAAALARSAGEGADPSTVAARRKVIEDLVSGEKVAAWCLGTAVAGVESGGDVVATPRGDGGLRLDGASGPVEAAGQADVVLVTARHAADGQPVQCLVSAGAAGLTTAAAHSVDLVRRYAGLRFEATSVEAVDVLGAGQDEVEYQLQVAVALQCAEMVGAVMRVFDMTVEYATDRYSFGRALVSYQALKHRFADMKVWAEAMAAAADAAARAVGTGGADAAELVSVAKSYAADKAPLILQDCVQIHGGIGVTWDHDLHLFLRRVIQDGSQWGTATEHRERIAVLAGLGAT